ncbi:HET-domain-containing protein [Hyaloscypha hepaticicola]|uniref:HET-domain-containing protein n=1 Tax=Hyaloscypha hepaticicola TaxID=2082293 RepID=A0A2J6PVN5_9HELO|nr:HET-domain-containing protein [Hyaloscypha hepaticicola]
MTLPTIITGTITRPAPPYNPHVLQNTYKELHRLDQQLHLPHPSPEFPPILLYILTHVLPSVYLRQRLLRTIDMKESIAHNIPDNLAESPQMAYKYEALANPRSFRLLTLEPGYEIDHIKCEITVLAMAEAPQYEALSYVWGSSERTHTITCNYMPLKVTASLDTVLRVRKPSGSRIIWIDQICIDQDNIPERSEQVQAMRDIYSRAHQVLMWLGKDDLSEASVAMDLINDIASLFSSSYIWDSQTSIRFPTDIELRERGLPLRESPSWNALTNMLKLPYFTRIWIIQEIAVAYAVIVMWGNFKILWVTVKVFWKVAYKLNLQLTDPQGLKPCPSLNLLRLPALFQPVRPWDTLLNYSQSFYDATDPRDRVFALIGLADDGVSLKENYQMTTSEVYAQATIHVIKTLKDLFVLSFTHDASPNSTSEFPSWAMSWSKTDSKAGSISKVGFHDSKESTPQLKEAIDWRILMLGGFFFDNVEHIGIPIKYENYHLDLVESFQLLRRHADKLGGVYGNGLIETFISTLTLGSTWNIERDGVSFGQSQEYVLSGFASVIANRSILKIQESLTEGFTPSCQRQLLELLRLTVEADPNTRLNRNLLHFSQDTRNWARELMVHCHASNQEAAITATKLINLVLDVLNPEVFRGFEHAMLSLMIENFLSLLKADWGSVHCV